MKLDRKQNRGVHKKSLLKNVIAILPAFNESRSLPLLLKELKRYIPQVLVVDDGSTDATEAVAKKAGVSVLRMPSNMGTGNATKQGLLYARKIGATIVCLLDADGQHNPRYIATMIHRLELGADMVIGSRYVNVSQHATSWIRRSGTKTISLLIQLFFGTRIYDPTSGFRVMNKKTMRHIVDHYPVVFSEPEVVLDLIGSNFRVVEVPVEMKPRQFGTTTIHIGKALYLMVYIVFFIVTKWIRRI